MRRMILQTLFTTCAISVVGMLNSVILSRWLGPVGRGEIAAAMLWPGLFIYLSSMGLIVATTYFSSLTSAKPRIVLNSALVMGTILGGLALPIGFVLMPWLLKSQDAAVVSASRWYLIVIPISLLNQFGCGVLQGRMRIAELNWLRMVIPAGYFLGTIILLTFNSLSLTNIIGLHLCLNAAALAVTLLVLRKVGIGPGLRTDFVLAKQMLTYGAKVHLGQISGLANVNLDQVLLAAWLPPAYLGLYVVAVSSAVLSQMLAGAVQTVSMPAIAKKKSEAERGELLQVIFR
ncbi:MAG TPA: oligosaccharide flippase family protein, partial [Pyrinomonadaceae bacterium]|nr:oligosaccharide flippase family protein [Pyrinomonadaceae bacterium]